MKAKLKEWFSNLLDNKKYNTNEVILFLVIFISIGYTIFNVIADIIR